MEFSTLYSRSKSAHYGRNGEILFLMAWLLFWKKPSTPASKLKPKTCFPGVTPTFSGGITQVLMWKLDHKEGWVLKNWYFWTETIESLLDSKEIKPVNPEGNQPWIFIGIADAVAEALRLWLPDDSPWTSQLHPTSWNLCCCCSVVQLCLTFCNPMDYSTPGLPILHHLPEFAQVHVHCIRNAFQPSHPLMLSSSALNLSQHQELFQRVGCSHEMTKILELQLQQQSFQWVFRADFP